MHSAAPAPSPEQFGTNSYPAKDATSAAGARQPTDIAHVGEVRHGSSADLARELAIQQLGREIELHMAEVAAINNRDPHVFADFVDASASRWMAQRARESMEKLIAGRSPEAVSRMERALGLDMPACANEERRLA